MDLYGHVKGDRPLLQGLKSQDQFLNLFSVGGGLPLQDHLEANTVLLHPEPHPAEVPARGTQKSLNKREDECIFTFKKAQGEAIQFGLVGTTLGFVVPFIMKTLVGWLTNPAPALLLKPVTPSKRTTICP